MTSDTLSMTPIYPGLQVDSYRSVWWDFNFSELVDETGDSFNINITAQDGTDFTWSGTGVMGGAGNFDGSYERRLRFGILPKVPGSSTVSDVGGVIVSAPAGAWEDRAGNPNTASSNSLYLAHNWEMSVADGSGEEGTDETIEFEVTLNARDDCKTVTVDWATADGTATAGEDYTAASGTLTFAPGETRKTVSIAVMDDTVEDNGETFKLQLSNASTATIAGIRLSLADSEATGTLFNHESPFSSVPQIAGVAQVGNTLSVSFTESPSGTVTYQWLRGSGEIAGATATTYVLAAADVGAQISVRVASGDESLTSAATAPVRAAPANPPLAAGEEEVLSAAMTLGSWDGFPARIAGYSRVLGASFGEMDASSFEDGGTTRVVDFFVLNEGGQFALATGATRPVAAGLVVYWNEHRISQLEVQTLAEGLQLLVGNTPQSSEAYMRYMDGASDGVRVAVSLRRVSVAAQDALTAEFQDVPDEHGNDAFTFKLRFSEELGLSYRTLQDHALSVTNGQLTRVARAARGKNQEWNVTVTPDNDQDVTVALAATTDCTATGAICTDDDRPLSAAVTASVASTAEETTSTATQAFEVRFEDIADEHDGSGPVVFKVKFNKRPKADYSYRTMRDTTLQIRQGDRSLNATEARRLNRPHNDEWEVTIEPISKEDLHIAIAAPASCSDTGAVCTGDDEVLSNSISKTIQGPPGLSVADARVEEAAGATLDFAVTLGRASSSTVTVDYATSDGTAAAGEDYTATSGTLTFNAGETSKTVSVPVLDDAHDEGSETLTLTLSNPSGGNAYLKDATATGTIENTDAMPQAWLARFGRTVAEQVIEAVEGRFSAPRAAGVEMTLAGERIGSAGAAPEDDEARAKLGEAEDRSRLEALKNWLQGTETADRDAGGRRAGYDSRGVTPSELLTGTSFALTGGAKAGGTVSLWGRGAVSRFDGREGDLSLDGEVASAMMGADWVRERWTAGLLVSRSVGEGGYRGPEGEGTVESTLTGFFPYVSIGFEV